MAVCVCCTHHSRAWQQSVSLLKGTGRSVGGSTAVAAMGSSIIPSQLSEQTTQKTTKPYGPRSCWAPSQARAGEQQSLQPLLPVKVRATFKFGDRLGYYPQCNQTEGFIRDDQLPNPAPEGSCPELCWSTGWFPEVQSVVGMPVQIQEGSWLHRDICCRDQSNFLIQERIT